MIMKRLVSLLIIVSIVLATVPAFADEIITEPIAEVVEKEPLRKLEVGSVDTGVSRSGEIPHPYEREIFRRFLIGSDRAFVKDTLENNMALTAELRAKSLPELEEHVTLAMKSLANSGSHFSSYLTG